MSLHQYMKVQDRLIETVRNHCDPEKPLPSVRSLSRQFQVSTRVVFDALRMLIADGLLHSRRGQGVFVHEFCCRFSSGTFRKKKILTLWGSGWKGYWDYYMMDATAAAFRELRRYPVMVQNGILPERPDDKLHALKLYVPDGILWCRPGNAESNLVAVARKICPVCVVGDPDDVFSVSVDYPAAGKQAANWFLDHGFRRTVLVGGREDSLPNRLFFDAWDRTFREHGVPDAGTRYILSGKKIAAELAARSGYDSLFVRAMVFDQATQALRVASRSVTVMIDNELPYLPENEFRPQYMMRLMPDEVARRSVKKLLRSIDDPGQVQSPELVPVQITEYE